MKTHLSLSLCAAVVALAAALPASAAVLLDTGTPDGSQSGLAVDSTDFLALRFNAGQAWTIDGVSAYLTGGRVGDSFALVLYKDAPGLPGDLLASTAVNFSADGWNGASALDWHLQRAGPYWLGIEGLVLDNGLGVPVPQGNFVATSGGLTLPGATAFNDGSGYAASASALQFGVRITGVVPEPTSLALLLAGLGLVGIAARRSRGLPG